MGRSPHGAKPPSHVAYYVALGGCVLLLLLLTGYLLYFCISKVIELSECESLTQVPPSRAPPPPSTAYPVQPGVREGATAMVQLCKQAPAGGAGVGGASSKGGVVFPTRTPPHPPPPPRDKTPRPPPPPAAAGRDHRLAAR